LSFSDGNPHACWMWQALREAEAAQARTSPNPPVGSVIVRDGVIVGRGRTQPPGQAHAEIVALRQAGERARGATLYVTLEPCAHYGRTPPCTDAIIAAGIAAVVAAVPDPDPRVNGRGIAQLRAAGITVRTGVCAEPAWEIIAGFAKRTRTGLPLVTLKYAMTLDGRIATRTGHSRWITGDAARARAHQLRDSHDVILVGSGTVRVDDPLLTTRLPDAESGAGGPHHPLRIVVTRICDLPLSAQLFSPALPGRTLVACIECDNETYRTLQMRGIEVVCCPADAVGMVDLAALLRLLGARGLNTVLAEGGARIHGALLDNALADRVIAFIAPAIVGGDGAPGPVGGAGTSRMTDAWRLDDTRVCRYGADLCVAGYLPHAATWRARPRAMEE
jgi:diaminohydroxyphosphoribosylaminopyrimidine deaminase/5-amino-6-(5-phosphoribosylamino)uracil reductase